MAMEFHHFFSRVAPGSGEPHPQDAIQHGPFFVEKGSVGHAARGDFPRRSLTGGGKSQGSHVANAIPREADDGDTPFSRGRGQGGDGIGHGSFGSYWASR